MKIENSWIIDPWPQYFIIQGKDCELKVKLDKVGIEDFAKAWYAILEIPEAKAILSKFSLVSDAKSKGETR